MQREQVIEGVYSADLWDRLDFHWGSYVKSPLQLRFLATKTSLIARALRTAIVDLLDHLGPSCNEYIENETTVLGTEHRTFHSVQYRMSVDDETNQFAEVVDANDEIRLEIAAVAPTVFDQLRKGIGISYEQYRQSFSEMSLKDFTNPGKSGSLMYKTHDDLFILKTLREYEARLLMQVLSGYHLQLMRRPSLLNRYIAIYSIRFPASISTIEIYLAVMVNAFTPSLQINEIFDLKGSKIKRKLTGNLSVENLLKLKDLDFLDLYPSGIRLPSIVYRRLQRIISNDAKVLKKLHITDFSLILGIRHLDASESELMQRRPSAGVGALMHFSHSLVTNHMLPTLLQLTDVDQADAQLPPYSYLKPIALLGEPKIDMSEYYRDDSVAQITQPMPGIINGTNQRVYLYLVIVDMLQTFDSMKHLDQTLRKLTDYQRHLEYSVIAPDEYEKRFNQFLFEQVFIDAQEDFPWFVTSSRESIDQSSINPGQSNEPRQGSYSIERECSDSVVECRF